MVYAMGKAVAYTLGVRLKEKNERRAKKAEGGNRRERKLKAEMKRLRQDIARVGNQLHRRKQWRKATKREKEIINQLRASMDGKEVTSGNLRAAKEQWLDKLQYKKEKLDKYVEKGNRKKDNIIFQKDQKSFFRTLGKVEKHKGEMPEMEKFVEFWGGIWEQNEPTLNMPWMEEVKAELSEKANTVSQLEITEEKLRKETSKRKNWTAPGIDGIQITGGRSLHRHRKRWQNHSRACTKTRPGYQNGGRREEQYCYRRRRPEWRKELSPNYLPEYIIKSWQDWLLNIWENTHW